MALLLGAAALLAGCAGQRIHEEGMKLVATGQRDAGIALLREASRVEPSNSQYRIDVLKETQAYARQLVDQGDEARRQGRAGEASDIYNRALRIDPGNDRAKRGLSMLETDARVARLLADSDRFLREGNTQAALERAEAALADSPAHAAARRQIELVQEQETRQRQQRAEKAAQQALRNKPVTLQFRDANLRMVFEALSRTTGVNVILDRDVRADLKTTIFVKDASVEDTIDLILLQNQLEKRSLNTNTLFIYPATAAKQKEYQELQVRTFHVSNIDVKYLQNLLKTVLKTKDVSVDERSGTLVLRDTPDTVAVAAKMIAAHDVPEAEVMLEVEVLEVAHDRSSNLGIEFPNSFSVTTPETANTLGALKAMKRGELLVPQLQLGLNFKLEDIDSNLLASPRIRARNKEKARILIGDRVPTIANTITPVQTGGGVVTGSITYQEVGLKLEFEPQIHSDLDVGIRIGLEVSNIVKEIPGPNGSLAYQIGTRNAQTVVRLRDGETQILGGLISSDDRNTSARVPGLGHLPMVGRIFGNNNGSDKKSEIVLSITPRIVRPPAMLDASLRTIFSGTESTLRERPLQLDPIGSIRAQSSGGTAPAQGDMPAGKPPVSGPAGMARIPGLNRGRIAPPGATSNPNAAAAASEADPATTPAEKSDDATNGAAPAAPPPSPGAPDKPTGPEKVEEGKPAS